MDSENPSTFESLTSRTALSAASAAVLEAAVQEFWKPAKDLASTYPSGTINFDVRHNGIAADTFRRLEQAVLENHKSYQVSTEMVVESIANDGLHCAKGMSELKKLESGLKAGGRNLKAELFQEYLRSDLASRHLERLYRDADNACMELRAVQRLAYGSWHTAILKTAGIGFASAGLGYGADRVLGCHFGYDVGHYRNDQLIVDGVLIPQIARSTLPARVKIPLLAGAFAFGRAASYYHSKPIDQLKFS